MGAGYPIGAVITRRDIADALARDYEYFSTFAATPAAAAAALAVLDVLETGNIPARAAAVGDHLRAGLRTLSTEDERLGEVRGRGLLAGVDVASRPLARALLEDLRDRGVLAGITGPTGTVLKVRPPLIWETAHADLFTDTVAAALRGAPARPGSASRGTD